MLQQLHKAVTSRSPDQTSHLGLHVTGLAYYQACMVLLLLLCMSCPAANSHQVQVVKLFTIWVGLRGIRGYLLAINPLLLLFDNITHDLWVSVAQPAVEGWHSHGPLVAGAAAVVLLPCRAGRGRCSPFSSFLTSLQMASCRARAVVHRSSVPQVCSEVMVG